MFISTEPALVLTRQEWVQASKIIVPEYKLDRYQKNQQLIKVHPLTGLINLTHYCTQPYQVFESPVGSELDVCYKIDIGLKIGDYLFCFQSKSSKNGVDKYLLKYKNPLSGSLGLKNPPCCLIPSQKLGWCKSLLKTKIGIDLLPEVSQQINQVYRLWVHLGKGTVPRCVFTLIQLQFLNSLGVITNVKNLDVKFLFV